MKIIAFTSLKGGAGKSTALMAAASVLVEAGLRIACFEADDNRPLAVWKNNGTSEKTWDDNCRLYPAFDTDQFATAVEHATTDGCEIALVDTRGGGSDLNQAILLNADVVVIPTSLSVMELDEALQTLEYVVEVHKAAAMEAPAGLLINRIPTTSLSSRERYNLELLAEMPVLDTTLPTRRAYADIKALGHLHLYHRQLMQQSSKRVMASHIRLALIEARKLTAELLDAAGAPALVA
ncbi:hypothetical protein L1787_00015 [Acuticoccus sp. M5D2P5]|uniref:nucleotide-binding protein n=1 Tax=Acuticoccus kalidii TaxID=2910977 RepID=UPI001F28E72B|nr:hypothetical protein [Acuticoccus kalidii]MCF3931798.1 hypothetical protein [Acuticoccus kalidii]